VPAAARSRGSPVAGLRPQDDRRVPTIGTPPPSRGLRVLGSGRAGASQQLRGLSEIISAAPRTVSLSQGVGDRLGRPSEHLPNLVIPSLGLEDAKTVTNLRNLTIGNRW
jgi:hypothetical protein